MNARIHFHTAIVAVLLSSSAAPVLHAQSPPPAPVNQSAPVQLPVEAWDVLRMAHGKVSDATLVAYIKNSGKVYPLGASEILYLRDQGLSDAVITAMLDQRANGPTAAPQPSSATSVWANSSPQAVAPTTPPPSAYAQAAPVYSQPAPVYTQPAPVYAYPSYAYGYYDYWPYYGAYWGYPAVSLNFGWWGGRFGGYRGWGGFHGGGHFGGFHGGHR
jgi:hypothetical protein